MPKYNGPTPNQIAQSLSQSPDGPAADLGLSFLIGYKILAWFAVIPGVLGLRSRYGERYLTADTAVFSWALVALCSGGTALADLTGSRVQSYLGEDASGGHATTAGLAFLALYSAMLAARFGGVMLRYVRDDFSVHSFSDGNPWRLWYRITRPLPATVQDGAVRCVLEPGAVFIVGMVAAYATDSRLLGLLALFASLGFFVQQAILQRELRAKLLNAADAAIEADELRTDRSRLQGGSEPGAYAAMVPPRARSGLSSLSIERLKAAREAAQLPLPLTEPARQSAEGPAAFHEPVAENHGTEHRLHRLVRRDTSRLY